MLDTNFNAKLGDFGLARLVHHGKGSQTTVLAGTMGYIHSFEVMALEIACGRKPVNIKAREDRILMVWAWGLYGTGNILEAAYPRLCAEFDAQQMICLMTVGLWCAHPDSNLRPSIREAIRVLEIEAPLPILPPKMPIPTYSVPESMSAVMLPSSSSSNSASERSHTQASSYSTDSSKMTASSKASSPSVTLLNITR